MDDIPTPRAHTAIFFNEDDQSRLELALPEGVIAFRGDETSCLPIIVFQACIDGVAVRGVLTLDDASEMQAALRLAYDDAQAAGEAADAEYRDFEAEIAARDQSQAGGPVA